MPTLSVQWKITLLSGCCLLLVAISLISFSIVSASSNQAAIQLQSTESVVKKSEQLLLSEANAQASKVQQYLDEAMYRAEMLAESISFLQFNAEENYTNSSELRTTVSELLKRSVVNFENMHGAFAVFEPNMLDGEDGNYIDAEYVSANEIGRFAPHWHKAQGSGEANIVIVNEASIKNTSPASSGQPSNYWYNCTISNNRMCVMDPYLIEQGGQQNLISTITVPLIKESKVIGVMGIDLKVATLQQYALAADQALFDGAGSVSIISNNGVLAGWDGDSGLVGKPVSADFGLPSDLNQWLAQGDTQSQWSSDGELLTVFMPIKMSESTWGVVITMPKDNVVQDALVLTQLIKEQSAESINIQLLTGTIVTLIGLVIIWAASFKLVAPIKEMVSRLQDIATGEGDLTQRLNVKSMDEMGELATWFNRFLERLQLTFKEVVDATNEMSQTSIEASRIAANSKEGCESQFKEVDMVATASEEMTQTASLVVTNADSAVQAATQADQSAQLGQQVVAASAVSMQELVDRMAMAVPVATKLEKNSKDITEILSVIEGISEQTNLLALNAAIEAARAGEQGRGFAVVADEVRQLARRTNDSVGEVREVIEQLQSGTRSVVNAISEGNHLAVGTAEQVQEAVQSLSQISELVSTIQSMNSEIVRAAEEQQSVSTEVNGNVSNIRDLSQNILEQSAASERIGHNIAQLSSKQQQLVGQFKVQ